MPPRKPSPDRRPARRFPFGRRTGASSRATTPEEPNAWDHHDALIADLWCRLGIDTWFDEDADESADPGRRLCLAHLSAEDVVTFVDGSMPPRERVQAMRHLLQCPQCREDVVSHHETSCILRTSAVDATLEPPMVILERLLGLSRISTDDPQALRLTAAQFTAYVDPESARELFEQPGAMTVDGDGNVIPGPAPSLHRAKEAPTAEPNADPATAAAPATPASAQDAAPTSGPDAGQDTPDTTPEDAARTRSALPEWADQFLPRLPRRRRPR